MTATTRHALTCPGPWGEVILSQKHHDSRRWRVSLPQFTDEDAEAQTQEGNHKSCKSPAGPTGPQGCASAPGWLAQEDRPQSLGGEAGGRCYMPCGRLLTSTTKHLEAGRLHHNMSRTVLSISSEPAAPSPGKWAMAPTCSFLSGPNLQTPPIPPHQQHLALTSPVVLPPK